MRTAGSSASRSKLEAQGIGHRCLVALPRIKARVGEHAFQPRKAALDVLEEKRRSIAVLDGRRMDHKADWQAECVNKQMDLAAFHLLSGIVAHRVGASAVDTVL